MSRATHVSGRRQGFGRSRGDARSGAMLVRERGRVKRNPAGHRKNMEDLLAWVASGKLKPRIHATFPLAETAEAIRVLDRREATGKVVLIL